MTPAPTTRVTFSLRDRDTGQLARLYAACDDSGDRSFSLDTDQDLPVFELASPELLQFVLMGNTPSYNSSSQLPNWGPWRDASQLEVVRISTTQTVEVVELPALLIMGRSIELRAIHLKSAERYAGRPLDLRKDIEPTTLFWLVSLPDGMSLDAAQAWVGKDIYAGDRHTKRTAYAIVDVPEDYADLAAGKNAVLVIASALVK